jgi:hypothetical protein
MASDSERASIVERHNCVRNMNMNFLGPTPVAECGNMYAMTETMCTPSGIITSSSFQQPLRQTDPDYPGSTWIYGPGLVALEAVEVYSYLLG